MDPWRKETLGLQVGDFIIWRDEAIQLEGQPALVAPGMKGKVISLHDSFGERHYQLGLLWLTTPAEPFLEFRSYYVWILVEGVAPEAEVLTTMDQEINSLSLHLLLNPCAA